MADNVRLVEPRPIKPNPENPRLIFHQDELDALQRSISLQGILVPLTVFQDSEHLFILDGERRWRCAVKLGLPKVPVIVQPTPTRMQNIMMMFAIHNARREWDSLPTALKLQDLELEFTQRYDKKPTEAELAEIASTTRGEVRRLRRILDLPEEYREELREELEKPRSDQTLTVNHVLETTGAVSLPVKRGVISREDEGPLVRALLDKFRNAVEKNTVAPRKLSRIARAFSAKKYRTILPSAPYCG